MRSMLLRASLLTVVPRAPNMLDPQSAHTYESICSQFISATPARRDGPVLVYDVKLSDGATFVINGCHK